MTQYAIIDECYAATTGGLHVGTPSIPYMKVKSIHYQTLPKKDTTWKIDVNINNLSVSSLQGLLLLFLDKRENFASKMKDFTFLLSRKFQQLAMAYFISFLQQAYKPEMFAPS